MDTLRSSRTTTLAEEKTYFARLQGTGLEDTQREYERALKDHSLRTGMGELSDAEIRAQSSKLMDEAIDADESKRTGPQAQPTVAPLTQEEKEDEALRKIRDRVNTNEEQRAESDAARDSLRERELERERRAATTQDERNRVNEELKKHRESRVYAGKQTSETLDREFIDRETKQRLSLIHI